MPKYFSSLTVIDDLSYINTAEKDILEKVYESTRPYGGKIVIMAKGKKQDAAKVLGLGRNTLAKKMSSQKD